MTPEEDLNRLVAIGESLGWRQGGGMPLSRFFCLALAEGRVEADRLGEQLRRQRERLESLEGAIRKHRDQRGDDRCWLDDGELYAALPEASPERPLAQPEEMLANCRRYVAHRHNPAQPYVSPQREIERLEAEFAEAERYARDLERESSPPPPERRDWKTTCVCRGTGRQWHLDPTTDQAESRSTLLSKPCRHPSRGSTQLSVRDRPPDRVGAGREAVDTGWFAVGGATSRRGAGREAVDTCRCEPAKRWPLEPPLLT